MGYPLTFLKRAFRNLYFLMFLNGFLLASLFYFNMESVYENGLFASIKYSIDSKIDADDTPDSIVVKAMNTCHDLMNNRLPTFSNPNTQLGAEAGIFHSTSVDLMTTMGACGSFSQVLARIIEGYHYPVRIAQMKANGIFGAHNIVEVNTGRNWIVLDPTFDVCFVRPDGRLASFDDVSKNWPYYVKQVPPNYDLNYRYEDVRYTNWTKIPVLMPALKKILSFAIGAERANTFSLRTLFMNTFHVYFWFALIFEIWLILVTTRLLIKTQVFPHRDIPFTAKNLIKYIRLRQEGASSFTH
jgi:hypothetical protein